MATAVSVLALGGCALLLLALRSVRTRSGYGYGRYWASLAILFAYLAIDEGVGLHEQLTNPASNLPFTTGFLAWGWVVVAIPFVIVVGAIYLRFVLHLPRSHALAVFIAGGAYVTGAVGCEMVGAKLAEDGGMWEFPYLVVMTLEETLEMTGIATFFVTLWSLLERHSPQFAWGDVRQRLGRASAAQPAVALYPAGARLAGLRLFVRSAQPGRALGSHLLSALAMLPP